MDFNKCLFCGGDAETQEQGPHHVIPQTTLKLVKWPDKQFDGQITSKCVPLCSDCHIKLTWLQIPLMKLIKYLVRGKPIPREFAFMVDEAWYELNEL